MRKRALQPPEIDWDNVHPKLCEWRASQDQRLGRAVFVFLESQIPYLIPSRLKPQKDPFIIHEAVRDTIEKIYTLDPNKVIENFKAYTRRILYNTISDQGRKTKERIEKTEPLTQSHQAIDDRMNRKHSPETSLVSSEERNLCNEVISRLKQTPRIVIKLYFYTYALTQEDQFWLADKTHRSIDEVATDLDQAKTDSELSLILTPEFPPGRSRESRLDASRKMKSRALESFREIYEQLQRGEA